MRSQGVKNRRPTRHPRPEPAVLAAVLLAACATAPKQPPPGRHGGADLYVCGGMTVANAPPTDRAGRIAGFEPAAEIRGRLLARAPVAGCLSSGYGVRPATGRLHQGIDLYTGEPSPVYAAAGGDVEFAGDLGSYGRTLLIRHGSGVKTRYAHLSAFARDVRVGATVRAGQMIAETGRTGNATAVHLHYEIIVDGRTENPLTVGE
ncbi:MAG: M23 family metallopeptidase [Parvularculaceae bacterium]|nr:M23 family metallopeptidase [Parvularculaceae bacterium]